MKVFRTFLCASCRRNFFSIEEETENNIPSCPNCHSSKVLKAITQEEQSKLFDKKKGDDLEV
jgi:DNA-directed RNA polymerase subunit RPC12/RpoP